MNGCREKREVPFVLDERSRGLSQGRLLRLEARFAGSRIWLGPAWALLCGAVASAGMDIGWQVLVTLLVALVLVDSFLGTVWSLAASDQWALASAKGRNPGEEADVPAIPYTLPGSPSYRIVGFLGDRLSRWRATVWPKLGGSIVSLTFTAVFALLLGAMLGEGPLLLTAVALAIGGSRLALARSREAVGLALGTSFLAGLPWLIGYVTFADVVSLSGGWTEMVRPLVWAGVYALAFHAYQLLSREHLAVGAGALNLAQVVAVAALVIDKQPIMAGVVALLLLPQMLLQPALLSTRDGLWYLGRVQGFTMAAMMATAVAAAT